jgi:hypothetical protein
VLTSTGVQLVRLSDGATLEVGLVLTGDSPPVYGRAVWLGSGHAEVDARARDALRVWTESGPCTGGSCTPFDRPGVGLDFVAPGS